MYSRDFAALRCWLVDWLVHWLVDWLVGDDHSLTLQGVRARTLEAMTQKIVDELCHIH